MAELVNDLEAQVLVMPKVTVEEVNRLLDVGRLLLSVLTPDELRQLKEELSNVGTQSELGNTGVT